jgi:hypothetical protein
VTNVVEKLRRVLPLLAILIALALPLMLVLEDFVRDAIVLPLAYLLWLVGVILDALPQALFLSLIVFLGAYIAARSLSRDRKPEQTEQPRYSRSEGAVALWLERIGRVSEGAYSRERLNYYLGQLLTRTIAHEEHIPPREILHAVDTGELDLPPEIRMYVDGAYRRGYPSGPRWYRRLATMLARKLKLDHGRQAKERELQMALAPALDYMERQLRMEPPEEMRE